MLFSNTLQRLHYALSLSGEYPAYSPVKHTQVSTTLTLYSNIRKLYHANLFKLAPRERMPVNAGKFNEALNAHSACNLCVFRPYACMSEWRVFCGASIRSLDVIKKCL